MGNTMSSFITLTAGEDSKDNWIVQLFQEYKLLLGQHFSSSVYIKQFSEYIVDIECLFSVLAFDMASFFKTTILHFQ